MTASQSAVSDFAQLLDRERGLVDRRIFVDAEIYQLELERIFARAWNFMCLDSQIPNPGDFFMTFIGEDRVICVRDNDAMPQVLINSCRHRGNAVCRAEEGHSSSFMCTYHGWTYDLKGALVGVPGFKEVYHEELERENWGLIKAAQVDTYKGFIFATMDAEAPGLNDYLGDVGRMAIDLVAVRGEIKAAPGIQKWIIDCNWKFAVDNVWDYYHAPITHSSALYGGWQIRLGIPGTKPTPPRSYHAGHMVVPGEYGHALSGPITPPQQMAQPERHFLDQSWRKSPEAMAVLGEVGHRFGGHPHVFPNMWIMPYGNQISIRLPRGPMKTELWWFTFTYEGLDADERYEIVRKAIRHNGPAGMFELDDGENWGESTKGNAGIVTRSRPLNYSMNVGKGNIVQDEGGPPHIEALVNEHGQMWQYNAWAEWMNARSWNDLIANHSIPSGVL